MIALNMTVADGVLMYETNSNILVKYNDDLKDQLSIYTIHICYNDT